MVKQFIKSALVASLVGVVPTASAHAAVVCGGTTLTFCVDFTLSAAGPANTWNLAVTYLSANATDSGVLSDFGIFGLAGATATAINDGPAEFHLGPTNCDLQDDACASADNPQPQHGLLVGETAILTFTSPASFNGLLSSTVQANAHIISYGDASCSIKVSTGNQFEIPATNGGSYNVGGLSSVDQCNGTTTTPEPASLFLVGSGLAGLAGLIRRRRAA